MNPTGKRLRSKVGFADLYLERYGSGPVEGLPDPDPDLFLAVIIPAYREPHLIASVSSLLDCDPPGVKWEIIININYPAGSPTEVVELSRQTFDAVSQLSKSLTRDDVRIHALWSPDVPIRKAGVGLARRIAMDQAVSRFNSIGRPDGILVSFDADSSCSKNFLTSLTRFYLQKTSARTANIRFEHPLEGPSEPQIYQSIAQYELYLRYMRLAIRLAGHPHSIHTVGSSFSLRSRTYVRVNGMGTDKAGEDFYFLHKCILLKNFWEINDAAVYPSSRESDRVSFGTGASISRLVNDTTLDVYNLDSFEPLKKLFAKVGEYWPTSPSPPSPPPRGQALSKEGVASREVSVYDNSQQITDNRQLELSWEAISPGLAEFLKSRNAVKRIADMQRDSASEETFREKFFAWFNGFMILQYLNRVHREHYLKAPVMQEASRLAALLGINAAPTATGLLRQFRKFEQERGNWKII